MASPIETTKTTRLLDSKGLENLNSLFNEATFSTMVSLTHLDQNESQDKGKNQVISVSQSQHQDQKDTLDSLYLSLVEMTKRETLSYRDMILEALDQDQTDLTLKHAKLLSQAIEEVGSWLGDISAPWEMKQVILSSVNYIFIELKNLFEQLVARWVSFYIKEFWIMLELGITEFSTMQLYVMEQTVAKSFSDHFQYPSIRELFSTFIEGISRKIGMKIVSVGFEFKERAHDALMIMNKGAKECICMSPSVARYEINRLKLRIKRFTDYLKKTWFIKNYTEDSLQEEFFKSLYENVENNPQLDFENQAASAEVYAPRIQNNERDTLGALNLHHSPPIKGKVHSSIIKDRDEFLLSKKHNATELALSSLTQNELTIPEQNSSQSEQNEGVQDLFNPPSLAKLLSVLLPTVEPETLPNTTDPQSEIPATQIQAQRHLGKEEVSINRFLQTHPGLNTLRKDKMKKMIEDMMQKKVVDVKYIVTETGQTARLVLFEGSTEYVMIRNDADGDNVVTTTQNNRWYNIDKAYMEKGMRVTHLLTSEPLKINLTSTASVGSAVAMTGSSAVGNFLYKLVEGKENINDISKDLAKDTGSSMAIHVLVTTMPFVAISIASVLGAYTINDLRKNKFIKGEKKAMIISDILARAGTKTAFAVGGAIVGQSLIPVPFLGAFIGGVVGGFTASALVSSYDNLIAKRVSMELFCFYCLFQLKKHAKWTKEPVTRGDVKAAEPDAAEFLDIIKLVLAVKISTQAFLDDLLAKQKDIREIMDEIYASIARKTEFDKVNEEFEIKWQSLIAFGFHSYYYYLLLTELDELQNNKKIEEKDKLEIMTHYEKMLNVEPVIAWLSPKISIFSSWRPLDRMILVVGDLLKNYKIVTLFKIKDPLEKEKEKSKDKGTEVGNSSKEVAGQAADNHPKKEDNTLKENEYKQIKSTSDQEGMVLDKEMALNILNAVRLASETQDPLHNASHTGELVQKTGHIEEKK